MKTNTIKNLKFLKLLFIAITLSTFNNISAQAGKILVYRRGVLHEQIFINLRIPTPQTRDLVVFQGDKVVFEVASGTSPKVTGLTDTNVMRWAGECIFMNNSIDQGKPKPFLFFDSNVHGVKKRRYPNSWANGKHLYPTFATPTGSTKPSLIWYANGRSELSGLYTSNTSFYDINTYLKSYKELSGNRKYSNSNKFFGLSSPSDSIQYQRNNQKEGLNMELLKASQDNKKFVAGLDPDELIYNNLNSSKIVDNSSANNKKFEYVADDQWKIISDKQRESINHSMFDFLSATNYSSNFSEIVDKDLYVHKTGSTSIENKTFNYESNQPMFNNRRPVYYNPDYGNKPLIENRFLEFSISGKKCIINLAVLSPLEGHRVGALKYDELSDNHRSNPKVNFYGIIDGPIHVARFQNDVKYTVKGLPRSHPNSKFYLVYTYENAFGIMHEQRKEVNGNSDDSSSATFNIHGGGYHDLTLRFKGDSSELNDDNEVIIAGKELIDIDLRFIFAPNNSENNDYSYNPTSTLIGTVKLNENKGNGKGWFISDNNHKLIANDYWLNHGYKDHNVVRTYTLNSADTMTLTVLDADPHTFVHYQPDFYLSERRLSKRLTNDNLANSSGDTKIEWFVAKDAHFLNDKIRVGYGRYYTVSPQNIWGVAYKGSFYLKAVYNDTSVIVVKIVQKELTGTIDQIIGSSDKNLGNLMIAELSDDQFELLNKIAPRFYKPNTKDKYKIYKVKDILSAYTYGEKQVVNQTKTANRYDNVGEHTRFSDMNNYNNTFSWKFTKNGNRLLNNNLLFYDFNSLDSHNKYVDNYQNSWFPAYWVRHLDSPVLSNEIPSDGDSRLRKFKQTDTWYLSLASYNKGFEPYEPWQARLPWISQTAQGYRARWNIKCIYDVAKLFNSDEFGKAYSVATNVNDYHSNVIGDHGSKIITNFDAKKREMQEFFYMLKNKEIVVVDVKTLNSSRGYFIPVIRVEDSGKNKIYEGSSTSSNTSPTRIAESKNEASLPINEIGALCTVYPNPNSVGIFSIDINVPQENSNVDLQLSDLNGRVIYNSLPKVVNGRYSTTIGENLNLPKGVYLLTLKINDLIETKKLIVN